MAFIWRRRSTTIVKLVAFLLAIWFCIAFLVYTDDTRRRASQEGAGGSGVGSAVGGGGGAGGLGDPIALALRNEPIGEDFGVNGNVIGGGGGGGGGGGQKQPDEADIPPTVGKHKVDHQAERQRKKAADQPKKKPQDDTKKVIDPPGNLEENPGELGKPVKLPKEMSEEMKKAVDDGWTKNAFNQYVSDLISVHRTLPDPRDAWCKDEAKYLTKLPKTDVIICFHNEAWTVLLRTVHSVLDRSPEHLIGKIILVDDYSDMPHLKRQLEDYFAAYPKVQIVRGQKREGLIRARILGANHAKSPVLTYLDSHCECTEGWLEPLLDRIARNATTVVCPVIDVISDETLEYHYRDSTGVNVGGFDWNLQFSWHPVPERERKRHNSTAEPVYSPTMAGGLFSIDREFFERLGTYDSGFDIWGGENLELSFKTWMCGGTLEIVPCSHVGHIFRKRSPYKWRSGVNVLKKNSVRLAEVWMDEYSQYYYHRIGNDKGDWGDVSDRRKLRDDLKCKSFKWYLDNIYPELFIPGDSVAHGEIRNLGYGGRTCLDAPAGKKHQKKAVGTYPCHRQGGNQYWMLSKAGEIRRDDSCLDYAGKDVTLFSCHGGKGNQFWTYRENTKQLHHGTSGKCLAISESKDKLLMEECNTSLSRQQWTLENYDSSKL
ncbi:LOW QUALITY PROTEIN: putative polypeptide N-acetylgalactosaminyltransferase 9 [Drosophila ficusphila]|uniref:LOW QUALITY PROTEIN: putative polypeptide N-acetylgalactosaminyltransferase 9 n=1 Tax=Drosophila ficusphila TaxID=30025 RepID=UPI0007E7AD23|nr:LOW QUALITY PROTEIN: putative polypeptide N-acetylgalactosaminyltransferase 9 [Drosophila ficusphila]